MKRTERFKKVLLSAAALRIVLGLIAIPLAPFLYKHHFVWLVLLRPTKEVLLAAGFFARRRQVGIVEVVLAALPLMVFGVWVFFLLGRGYSGKTQSKISRWLLPSDKIEKVQRVLKKKGSKVVLLARLAAFPSSLVGAAAGSSAMPSTKFLVADAIGAFVTLVEFIGVGYVLGETYQRSKPWLAAIGVAVVALIAVIIGRYLKRE